MLHNWEARTAKATGVSLIRRKQGWFGTLFSCAGAVAGENGAVEAVPDGKSGKTGRKNGVWMSIGRNRGRFSAVGREIIILEAGNRRADIRQSFLRRETGVWKRNHHF